jgi:hypothetical protein
MPFTYQRFQQIRQTFRHFVPSPIGQTLADIRSDIQALRRDLMASLTPIQDAINNLKADVEAETEVDNSVLTLLTGQAAQLADIKKQLADAIAANDPTLIQAAADALTALHTTMVANATSLVSAVTANTPAQP